MLGLRAILVSCLSLLAAPLLSGLLPPSKLQSMPNSESQTIDSSSIVTQNLSTPPQVKLSVPAIAQQVTVRIVSDRGMGSGVIVDRNGQTYTVVTNDHVLADSKDHPYTILTADGRTHSGRWLPSANFPNLDLALVQFQSQRVYQVAVIADWKTLAIGDPVYAAGFPNWHWINSDAIEETRHWGTKAFRLTSGKVGMLPDKSLQEGYQLGYTNDIEEGMSGGPVLDRYGRLMGINGRAKYPFKGINVFIFADGSLPSEELFREMESLSWAIPVTRFQQAIR
ncbi:MAG: serine protease [Phormidium sp.]